MMLNKILLTLTSCMVIVTLSIGCGTAAGEESPEIGDRGLFDKAQEYIKDEDYKAAISVLNTLENNFPNSIYYQQARLIKADALFAQELRSVFIEAEAEYKAYMTLYPTSDNLDYIQKQIALCHWNRHRSYKKDQTEVKRAIEEFNLFLKKYPNSKYTSEVKKALDEAHEHLAQNEEYVGDYYMRIDKFSAAEKRYTLALEHSKNQESKYERYFKMLQSLQGQNKLEEAQQLYEKVLVEKEDTRTNSPLIAQMKELLDKFRKNYVPAEKEEKKTPPENTPESEEII